MFRFLRFFRFVGNLALWAIAALGVVAALFWIATASGVVEPLIVISGSMEPGIDVGDLLLATKTDTADLRVGDVVSLPSEQTRNLVTHRIVSINPLDGNRWEIEMRGDANPGNDIAPYVVGDQVWQPTIRIPGVGSFVSIIMRPGVTLPGVIALAAFLGFAILSDDDEDEDDDEHDEHDDDHRDDDHLDTGHRDDRRDSDLAMAGAPWPAPGTQVEPVVVRELEVASR